ncbi:MAG TPA: hypothetical protein PKW55_04630 [Spirochaetota bacterium]|nr:hypothetical protein [Spirochaetota bacterium]HOM37876.1 hypothetical protein [Spirochaetota bacterium]HPQ48680.1 hypothetical protein [Spirochaetota bacterium]
MNFIKDPKFYEYSLYAGFIPMYNTINLIFKGKPWKKEYTLLKIHKKRAVLFFEDLVIHKTTKKKSQKYILTIDKDFNSVFEKTNSYHIKKNNFCWFSESLKNAISSLIKKSKKLASFHSIELWNKNTGEIVAGDIGVVIGSRYLSMTGFYSENGSGSVLLVFLGKVLQKLGIKAWDLGMDLPYKRDLGAKLLQKNTFLEIVEKTRNQKINFKIDRYEYSDFLKDIK